MSENPSVPYVSAIKINGQPILPPLITPELRKELLNYKQQAIKLEKLLKNCSDLRKNVEDLLEASTRPSSQLTFGDNSHIEALNISKEPRKLKNVQLSKDLIEVTEYNANGLKLINNRDNFRYRSYSVSAPPTDFLKPCTPTKPKLIRSNSYTLDSPSPILLEHLKKASVNNQNSLADSPSLLKKASVNNQKFLDSPIRLKKALIDNQHSLDSHIVSVNKQCVEEIKSPTIEVYQTDISVQQITVNNGSSAKEDKKQAFFDKNLFEPDSELIEALKDIPENYANQIIDLLKQQHVEQKERLERNSSSPRKPVEQDFDNLIDFSSFIDDVNETSSSVEGAGQKLRRSSTFSMSPSQSLYYSLTSDNETLPAQIDDKLELGVLQENNDYWEGYLMHDSGGCSRELFPKVNPTAIKSLKKEWAASVIGAHVKGFLTRRLLKTEKVQTLIATVKDVLVCAVELHRSDNIDEKDVELHRRLINQLSAALYAFHDVFFALSTQEQMALIAADRQRKIDKLKRPQSGRGSARKSFSKSDLQTPSRSSSKHKLISESPCPSLTKV